MPSSSTGAAVPLNAAAVAIDAVVPAGEPFTLTIPFGSPHKTLPDGSNCRVKLVENSCDEPPHADVPALVCEGLGCVPELAAVGTLAGWEWPGVTVLRGIGLAVCFCPNAPLEGFKRTCPTWLPQGYLHVEGPTAVVQTVTAPGLATIRVEGHGLLQTDVLAVGRECPRPGVADSLATPLGGTDTELSFTYPVELGEYLACWSRNGEAFVPAAIVIVEERKDCIMTEWSRGECSRECGGGLEAQRREVLQEPRGGGRACGPVAQEVGCNVNPCPRPSIDKAWSEPRQPIVGEPFQILLQGKHLLPSTRVLLSRDSCSRERKGTGGGASCDQPGSSRVLAVCGDRHYSITLDEPGVYNICICNGHSYGRGEDGYHSVECTDATMYGTVPQVGKQVSIVTNLAESDTGASQAALIGGSCAAAALLAFVVYRLRRRRSPPVKVDPVTQTQVPQVSPEDLAKWEVYYTSQGYPPGTAWRVLFPNHPIPGLSGQDPSGQVSMHPGAHGMAVPFFGWNDPQSPARIVDEAKQELPPKPPWPSPPALPPPAGPAPPLPIERPPFPQAHPRPHEEVDGAPSSVCSEQPAPEPGDTPGHSVRDAPAPHGLPPMPAQPPAIPAAPDNV